MDFYQLGLLSFVIYAVVELMFRGCILFCISDKACISWRIFASYKYLHLIIPSPGLWASENYKEAIKKAIPYREIRKELLSKFIKLSNCCNIIFSLVLFFITLCIPRNGDVFVDIFLALIMCRYISRSVEIMIAFGSDVLSPHSSSNLDNNERMFLAIKSYLEIFIYSAAFYSVFLCDAETIFDPILTSLFVGTLTNISGALAGR